ncbi:MAG: polysaccharide biosynthesis tyrosine autokinase [Verrucomicrobia bacterium]|nr:polysaccharide biosynthesis tyrosine autokinase [Verrucomicrobiota bacterium]MBV8481993.1 polysaccharide biosynthesis tyrosine autokinase [Verrucomicrobiota bacterium]
MHTRAVSTQLDNPDLARSFGFGHFFNLFLSKAWLILLFSVLSLVAAGVYLQLTPKLYESHTVIEVESKSGQAKMIRLQTALQAEVLERQATLTKAQADRDSALAELQADERLAQRGLISALDFQKAQISANEHSANYDFEKKRYENARLNNFQDFDSGDSGTEQDVNLDENIKTVEQAILNDTLLLGVLTSAGLEKDPSFAPPKKDGSVYLDSELVARFRPRVKTAVRHGTRLIDISVKDTDAKRAAQLAEAIAKAFIDQNSQGLHTQAGPGQETNRLETKLLDAQQPVQKFPENHGSTLSENNQKIAGDKLKELNLKLTEAKSERMKLEADAAVIQRSTDPQELLALPSIASFPDVASLRQQLSDYQRSRHPARSQLIRFKQAIDRAVLDAAHSVTQTYENKKATEAQLAKAIQEQGPKTAAPNEIPVSHTAPPPDVDAGRGLYQSALSPMNVSNIANRNSDATIRIVSTPLVAKTAEPDQLKTLLLALLIGITCGGGLVIIIDMVDNSIRTIDQAEGILGVTALAAIPESQRISRKKEPALTSDPTSYEAEAFRSLRTTISFLGLHAKHKTILFTSANPKEGKSFCALNYSVALAQTGLRTLLIDADVRRPRLSNIALADTKAEGLTDCLAGRVNAIDCCSPTGIENLFMLPAGRRTSRPSELFASCDFVSLLDELGTQFARIVLDSAPVNAVSDTQLICRHVQSVCLVVRAIKTPAAAVARARALLTQAGSSLQGFVFNRMPLRSGKHYYFSGYANCYAHRGKKQKLKPKAKLFGATTSAHPRISQTTPADKT